ncbi:MAG: hypothetical protein M3Q42_10150 [Pseudomonadota bacterium]|nr:hypothetical protein [Pseudomonadota bacterium]
MSIRRLNYTNRKKLTLDQVHISLTRPNAGPVRMFTAELTLPSSLPGDARVFVEAYRSSPAARMRFDYGTVSALRPPAPEHRMLTEFDIELPPPLFRVKITDITKQPGRLVADAQRIRPVDPDEQPNQQRGILYTAWRDNNGLVWDLDILDDIRGPILYIDETADPDRELPARTEFKALVYPEIMRRMLAKALDDGGDDPDGWQHTWLQFPRQTFGFMEPPPAGDDEFDNKAWIDNAVRACSRAAGFCAAMAPKESEQ